MPAGRSGARTVVSPLRRVRLNAVGADPQPAFRCTAGQLVQLAGTLAQTDLTLLAATGAG
jgi:hypothetical protein